MFFLSRFFNIYPFSFRSFSRCSWGIPPKPGLSINIVGSIKKLRRIPIRDKNSRLNLKRYNTFFQKAMDFQTISLPSLPKSFATIWLPDILNDLNPTILEHFEIIPSHSIPPVYDRSFFLRFLFFINNVLQHTIIRIRLWFSKEKLLSCEDAKVLFNNLLFNISSSEYSNLDTICSLSLIPHLKNLYFSNGSITHWTIQRHVIEPSINSIRLVKINKDIKFLQVIFQFTSDQALVKYSANGQVIFGDLTNVETVKDYIIFEKILNFPYSSWKIVDRIGGFDKSFSSFPSRLLEDYTR